MDPMFISQINIKPNTELVDRFEDVFKKKFNIEAEVPMKSSDFLKDLIDIGNESVYSGDLINITYNYFVAVIRFLEHPSPKLIGDIGFKGYKKTMTFTFYRYLLPTLNILAPHNKFKYVMWIFVEAVRYNSKNGDLWRDILKKYKRYLTKMVDDVDDAIRELY